MKTFKSKSGYIQSIYTFLKALALLGSCLFAGCAHVAHPIPLSPAEAAAIRSIHVLPARKMLARMVHNAQGPVQSGMFMSEVAFQFSRRADELNKAALASGIDPATIMQNALVEEVLRRKRFKLAPSPTEADATFLIEVHRYGLMRTLDGATREPESIFDMQPNVPLVAILDVKGLLTRKDGTLAAQTTSSAGGGSVGLSAPYLGDYHKNLELLKRSYEISARRIAKVMVDQLE